MFVHLRARSAYSLLESTLTIKKLAALCLKHEMPALALTDANNLFGALEFSETFAEKGLQPIVGLTLDLKHGVDALGAVALIAQNEAGYGALMRLSTRAYQEAPDPSEAAVSLDALLADADGLIALTGGAGGPVNRLLGEGREGPARALLGRFTDAFRDRLYIELQRHEERAEVETEGALVDLAYDLGLPLVATNDIRFEAAEGWRAHDALTCIAGGATLGDERRARLSKEHRFKSSAEMRAAFDDLPEAFENAIDVARRCAFRPRTRKPILPRFTTEAGRDETAELAAQAEAGLERRLDALGSDLAAEKEAYRDRLAYEIGVIQKMGFSGYFLIVSDFIKWAKAQGVPVGPGRGSGAGSLVAYALEITNLDPLRFGLLFERFLNPERVSMPDFDIDFCQERRGEVIDYVRRKYGDERVAQIITFGTLQARAVVRDVGRVLQQPFGLVDKIAKLIPQNPANPVTLAQAIETEDKLQDMRVREPEVAELLDIALQLEGLYRNASTHAAGVVIGDRPLSELVPLYKDPRSDLPATQFNMKWVEPAGLVKFDFLGLKTLTVIERALGFLKERGVSLDIDRIPIDDRKTYELLASGATYGVFQLESQGMRDTLRKVKPDKLEDIIALISLYRPGPMKNIDIYADVKFGRMAPDYLHPTLEPILKETYGVIIYQEQVMQIAQVLSGYSLGEADLLRRAMGKKKPEEMAKQKTRFIDGARDHGVDAVLADRIFELVAEFAGYGFNKSHAAAYAMVSFQTAYLKANHPVEFMAASMSLDLHMTDKLASFHQDARRCRVPVLPPDLNRSGADFTVEDGAVRYALGAVKAVGLGAMQALVAERERGGPFKDLADLSERLDPGVLNKRQLENLAKAGALDGLEPDRARAFALVDEIMGRASRAAEDRASAQSNLLGFVEQSRELVLKRPPKAWSAQERLDNERDSVGFYLSGHPLESFFETQPSGAYLSAADLAEETEGEPRAFLMAGVVRRVQERPAQSGGKFAYVALSDPTGEFEAMVMPEVLPGARDLLQPGRALVFKARLRWREGDLKISVEGFRPIEAAEASASGAAPLEIVLREGAPLHQLAEALAQLARADDADLRPLRLVLRLRDGREVRVRPKGLFPAGVKARAALKAASGVERVA